MQQTTSTTYEYLLKHYGPLLTLKHVAELMHTTPAGVRMSIARQQQPFAVALSAARRRLGRRVYFEARRVADMIDHNPLANGSIKSESEPLHAPRPRPMPSWGR